MTKPPEATFAFILGPHHISVEVMGEKGGTQYKYSKGMYTSRLTLAQGAQLLG